MRMSEVEGPGDFAYYMLEVVNPVGYALFLFEEDKDYYEKVEHAALLNFGLSFPIHLFSAMSSGGYWANLPAAHHRWMIKKQMLQELYGGAARYVWSGAGHAVRGAVRAAPVAGWLGAGLAAGYGIVKGLEHVIQDVWLGDMDLKFGGDQ